MVGPQLGTKEVGIGSKYRDPLMVQWLRLCLLMKGVQVWVLIGELDPHTPCSQKTKKENRSHIVTNSKKPLKTVYIKKKILKTGRSKYLPQIFYVGEWQTWVWASLVAQESACNIGDPGSISGLGRSLGEGNGYLLNCSCLENSMDRGAWQAIVHGVAKSWERLSD